jgi:hypothetical protein
MDIMHGTKLWPAFRLAAVLAMSIAACPNAKAGFVDYAIRGNSASGMPVINDTGSQIEFLIVAGSQKAGYGSNDVNGALLGQIASLWIERTDDNTVYAPGSGPRLAPYLNIWVTDGAGHYAVIANEPTNAEFAGAYNGGYNFTFDYLANKTLKVYENSNKTWLPNNGVGLKFSDLAGFRIQSPYGRGIDSRLGRPDGRGAA